MSAPSSDERQALLRLGALERDSQQLLDALNRLPNVREVHAEARVETAKCAADDLATRHLEIVTEANGMSSSLAPDTRLAIRQRQPSFSAYAKKAQHRLEVLAAAREIATDCLRASDSEASRQVQTLQLIRLVILSIAALLLVLILAPCDVHSSAFASEPAVASQAFAAAIALNLTRALVFVVAQSMLVATSTSSNRALGLIVVVATTVLVIAVVIALQFPGYLLGALNSVGGHALAPHG